MSSAGAERGQPRRRWHERGNPTFADRLRGSRAVRGDMGPSGLQRPPGLAGWSADGGYPLLLRNHAPPGGRVTDAGQAISVRAYAGRRRASLLPRARARACVDGDRDPRLRSHALRALSGQAHRDTQLQHLRVITLHYVAPSNGLKIAIAPEEMALEFEVVDYTLFEAHPPTAAFRPPNPTCKPPVPRIE